MATMTVPFCSDRDMFMLATATVFDAREAALELPSPSAVSSAWAKVRSCVSLIQATRELRHDFVRLAGRQSKLIARLENEDLGLWKEDDCSEMAWLLNELVTGEKSMLDIADSMPKPMITVWHAGLSDLHKQIGILDDLCTRFDAYSVHSSEKPGDAGMSEFMRTLGTEPDYDFDVTDSDRRERVHA